MLGRSILRAPMDYLRHISKIPVVISTLRHEILPSSRTLMDMRKLKNFKPWLLCGTKTAQIICRYKAGLLAGRDESRRSAICLPHCTLSSAPMQVQSRISVSSPSIIHFLLCHTKRLSYMNLQSTRFHILVHVVEFTNWGAW